MFSFMLYHIWTIRKNCNLQFTNMEYSPNYLNPEKLKDLQTWYAVHNATLKLLPKPWRASWDILVHLQIPKKSLHPLGLTKLKLPD